jgi:transposase
MKFGKRRASRSQLAKALPGLKKKKGKKKPRFSESYRRPEPSDEQITKEHRMEIKNCSSCGMEFTEKKDNIHYREDLDDVENLLKSATRIVKTIVESGKCKNCGNRESAMDIPKQKVIIGENVRSMLVYMIVFQGQSYAQAQKSLQHQYGIKLSNGEIANILEGESILLTPYYNHIVQSLQEENQAHYDETRWKTESRVKEVSEGNYCWVKTSIVNSSQLIWFGRSRGKEVAKELRGEKKGSIGVSDDYGGYRNLFDYQQLCWSHPYRKLRDLAQSQILRGKQRQDCCKAYRDFANVYQKAEKIKKTLQSGIWDEAEKTNQQAQLEKEFVGLFESKPDEPEKLKAIRKSLQEKQGRYFTFFRFHHLPLDNNKAERAIRKIVLKRKKSFGCRSQEGADILSILYSVIFTLTESNPDKSFFTLYRQAVEFEDGQ